MSKYSAALVAIALLLLASSARAAIVFDDFETNMGHFASHAGTSSTTNILNTTTVNQLNANALTTVAPLQGNQSLQIGIQGNNAAVSAGFPRIRFLSGGGTPANNISFTSTAGVDGWIGFYYKIPAPGALPGSLPSGMTLALNLDGTSADAGKPKPAVMDGQWHLVEWNIDAPTDWEAFQGVGGDGVLSDGESHTIDSIYFRYPVGTAWPGYNGQQNLFLDFVALNDAGSVANLVPEPTSLGLLALLGLAVRRRR